MALDLGPFRLGAPLGEGGMGVVFAGVHRPTGTPVAIKVLHRRRPLDAAARRAFLAEVQALAALDHPGIVALHDHGLLPPDPGIAGLRGGHPYLVMALLEGGAVRPPADWEALRGTLLDVLAGLAHAHARGVLHRDLKPSNLLCGPDGRVVLTDFGIARTRRDEPESGGTSGTPAFMAPEQCYGRARDEGPWTDLYGLGCVAWALATGQPPFGDAAPLMVMRSHLEADPPPLAARFAVPAEFEAWARRLLQKRPVDRFQRAADAAWALRGLAGPSVAGASAPEGAAWDDATRVTGRFDAPAGAGAAADAPALDGAVGALGASRPPLSPDGQAAASAPHRPLPGAGLALVGLRPPPLQARAVERAILWPALCAVDGEARPRLVVLRGPSGVGKTRLATWLGEQAHEAGAATLLRADHAPGQVAGEALRRMAARHLGVEGLDEAAARRRLDRLCGARAALLEGLLLPRADRTPTAAERHAALLALLRLASRARPVVAVFDDVQWGADALALATRALAATDLPALLIATVRDDLLSGRPAEAAALAALRDHPAVVELAVGALSDADVRALLRGWLALDEATVRRAAGPSGGNPAFAVGLVRAWAASGALAAQGAALGLATSGDAPADLAGLGDALVRDVLAAHPGAGDALLAAATLGRAVDDAAWAAVLGGFAPDDLVADLAARGLATPGEGGWSFRLELFRDAVLRRAPPDARAAMHRRCADALAAVDGTDERVGPHLAAAGEHAAALPLLAAAARRHIEAGDTADAAEWIERWRASAAHALAPGDPRHLEGPLLAARLALVRGRLADAEAELVAAERGVEAGAPDALASEAAVVRSRILFERGECDAGLVVAERAVARALASGEAEAQGEAHRQHAHHLTALGRFVEAEAAYALAIAAFEAAGRGEVVAKCLLGIAMLAKQRDELDRAIALVDEGRSRLEALGASSGVADAWHDLGELARLAGALDEAERAYRTARDRYEALGSDDVAYCDLNLGLVCQARGDFDGAAAHLRAALDRTGRTERRLLHALAHASLLPCAAAAGDWAAFDAHRAAAGPVLDGGVIEADLATVLELAGDLAADRWGEVERARALWTLAAERWRALGRAAEEARCRARL